MCGSESYGSSVANNIMGKEDLPDIRKLFRCFIDCTAILVISLTCSGHQAPCLEGIEILRIKVFISSLFSRSSLRYFEHFPQT